MEIDAFVVDNVLNECAAMALRSASSAVQRFILDLGSLIGISDKSTALLSRVRQAQGLSSEGGAMSSRMIGIPPVEEFIIENWLNEEAAESLRQCEPDIQRMVLARGSLQSCRDPSGGCYGRIRDARNGKLAAQDMMSTPAGQLEEVEKFISDNGLHEKAATALRSVGADIQRFVLDLGSLDGCHNKSAGCLGRINKAQRQVAAMGKPATQLGIVPPAGAIAPGPGPEELEVFIAANQLNQRSADALRGVPGAVQRWVMERGSLLTCRDASAGAFGRIKLAQSGQVLLSAAQGTGFEDAQHQHAASGEYEVDDEEVGDGEVDMEQFISDNWIQGRAADVLRTETQKVQRYVIGMGPVEADQDRSAACLARVSKYYRVATKSAAKAAAKARAKSWAGVPAMVPPKSFRLGGIFSKPLPRPDALSQGAMNADVEGILSKIVDMEGFIAANELSESAAAIFRATPLAIQRAVIQRGSVRDTPNPSGAILARIRAAKMQLAREHMEAQRQKLHLAKEQPWKGGALKRSWDGDDIQMATIPSKRAKPVPTSRPIAIPAKTMMIPPRPPPRPPPRISPYVG